jgi:predicted Zn-dependent peptidase
MAEAFPPTHPYHHAILGSMADLAAASLDDVRQFFRTYYAPNNAVLVLAGDFDLVEARQQVRKHFAAISRGLTIPTLPNAALPPLRGAAQRQVVPDASAPSPAAYVAFRVPPARDSSWAAVQLLASVLADGKSGRLYDALVRERQLATVVFGGNSGLLDGADLLAFGAIGRPGVDPVKLERALQGVLDSARAGVSPRLQLADVSAAGEQSAFAFGASREPLALSPMSPDYPSWLLRLQCTWRGREEGDPRRRIL